MSTEATGSHLPLPGATPLGLSGDVGARALSGAHAVTAPPRALPAQAPGVSISATASQMHAQQADVAARASPTSRIAEGFNARDAQKAANDNIFYAIGRGFCRGKARISQAITWALGAGLGKIASVFGGNYTDWKLWVMGGSLDAVAKAIGKSFKAGAISREEFFNSSVSLLPEERLREDRVRSIYKNNANDPGLQLLARNWLAAKNLPLPGEPFSPADTILLGILNKRVGTSRPEPLSAQAIQTIAHLSRQELANFLKKAIPKNGPALLLPTDIAKIFNKLQDPSTPIANKGTFISYVRKFCANNTKAAKPLLALLQKHRVSAQGSSASRSTASVGSDVLALNNALFPKRQRK